MSDMPGDDSIVVRSVTVSEVMAGDGQMWLTIETIGEPTVWQQLGMLEAGIESARIGTRAMWAEGDFEAEDD